MEENNTVNQDEGTKVEEQKTFTQEDVNRIVQERIIRDRKDRADYDELKAKADKFDALEEASKSELQKATERAEKLEAELTSMKRETEIREMRQRVSAETGVPIDLLNGEDEEACKNQANAILAFKGSNNNVNNGYPTLKDGGEPTNKVKGSTKQQFADWLDASLS